MKRDIVAYYDSLAPTYDQDRFGNSYGQFIDAGERRLLQRWLGGRSDVLEIACGTGRLSSFARVGCDPSCESLKAAQVRHPRLTLVGADAARLPFEAGSFDGVFCFHLLMHLDAPALEATIAEAARVLRRDGVLIIDVLSALRRRLRPRRERAERWHGRTTRSVGAFHALGARHGLRMERINGVLCLPIQRMPDWLRPRLATVDRVLCSVAPALSSSLIGCFVKI